MVRLSLEEHCSFPTTLPKIGVPALTRSFCRLQIYTASRRKVIQVHTATRLISFHRIDIPRPVNKMPVTLKEFETVFPKLVEDLKEHCNKYKLPQQALKWFEQVRIAGSPRIGLSELWAWLHRTKNFVDCNLDT